MIELETITKLIESLRKLPGVGIKTAERMAYQILEMKEEHINDFVLAMNNVKSRIKKCPICGSYMEDDWFPFCNDMEIESSSLVFVTYFRKAVAV